MQASDSYTLTTNSAKFTRPNGGNGTYYFIPILVTISTSGTYKFESNCAFDIYGYLYKDSFQSSDPNTNLIAADDDGGHGRNFTLTKYLTVSQTTILVITTYRASQLGPFSIKVYGPDRVSLTTYTPPSVNRMNISNSNLLNHFIFFQLKFFNIDTVSIVSGATYQLLNVASNKPLEADAGSISDRTNVQINTNHKNSNQCWIIYKNHDATVRLINKGSGKALDTSEPFGFATNVQIYTDNGSNRQKWRLKSVAVGTYALIHVASNMMLDVQSSGTADRTNVQLWPENNTAAQHWQFILNP